MTLTRQINTREYKYMDHPYFLNPDKTIWDQTKEMINNKQKGDIISREEIIDLIYKRTYYGSCNTISSYLNCLNKVGIIKHDSTPGVYIKMSDIPFTLTTSSLKEIAFDKSWKNWFIPLELRLKEEQ